jgi:hypothetical protein
MTAEAAAEDYAKPAHSYNHETVGYNKGAVDAASVPGTGFGTSLRGGHIHGQGWEHPSPSQEFLGDGLTFINDSLLYEAFGTEAANNDVYNLLTSHFT